MKTAIFLMALLAMGAVGCKSNKPEQNAGALGTNYDVEMGEGRSPIIQSNASPDFPQGQYYLWRYKGITPTTP